MKRRVSICIRKLLSCNATRLDKPNPPTDLDLREEYANAFRTESYIDFWTRVLALNDIDVATCKSMGSTTATRLSSYRLFVEHLLEPDQPTINRILDLTRSRLANFSLLSQYFSQTADASLLCGVLLKDIEHTRVKYRVVKTTIDSIPTVQFSGTNHLPVILTRLTEFSNSANPFVSSASSPRRFQVVQANCSKLIKRLESSRNKVRAKLRLVRKFKFGWKSLIVVVTTALIVIVATHALAVLVAAPGIIVASIELASARRLTRLAAQLDTAAKGAYILNRDLDTISRLVARLKDEVEHMRGMVRFWVEHGEDRLQASGEVARQLKRSDAGFREQLDELEEHLYLCFMTINRARNLVLREILDPDWRIRAPNKLSM